MRFLYGHISYGKGSMKNVHFFRTQKYHNKSCRCHAAHQHDSIFEAQYCDDLHILLKQKEIKAIACQVGYTLDVNDKHICNHIVDFVVTNNDGTEEVREVKGFATDVWAIKHKLFLAIYPDLPYHIITKDGRYDRSNQVGWARRRNSR